MGARRQRGRTEAITAGPSRAAVVIPITPASEDGNPLGRMQYTGAQLNAFIGRLGLCILSARNL
jgi:hypothetical protein